MNFSIFKIFQIFGIVSSWANKALADGKVTLNEATDLAIQLAEILGVTTEIEVPTGPNDMLSDIAEPGEIGKIWSPEPEETTGKPKED